MCLQNEINNLPVDFVFRTLWYVQEDYFMKTMSEKQVKSALVFINQAMKNLDKIAPWDFKMLINALHKYSIEQKAYYEILSITLSRIHEKFDLHEKSDLIYKLTIPRIDEASIFMRTEETLREYVSFLMHNQGLNTEGELDILQLQFEGVFSQRQLTYLEEKYLKNEQKVHESEEILERIKEKDYEEAVEHLKVHTFGFIKIFW